MADGDIQVTLDDTAEEKPEGEVDLEEPEAAPFSYEEADTNLVESFMAHPDGLEALKEIADTVYDDFEADYEATTDYRDRMASMWKLFIGDLPPKEYPFENAANPHMPIVLENISRLVFRAVDELFSDWQNVFGVLPVGPADTAVADVLTLHGNWQIRQAIPDFKRQMHKGMLAFFLVGDVTCHSYFDESSKQNCHEILTPDEFVTPYMHASASPSYGDLPHYSKILNYPKHRLQQMRDVWMNVEEVLEESPPSWGDDPEQVMERAAADAQGIDPESSSSAPYKLIWYEGWLELPNQDRDRFCQVILDHRTRNILKLCIQEEADWRDAQRHQQQQSELDAYRQGMQQHQQMTQQAQTASAIVQGATSDLSQQGELGPLQQHLIQSHLGEAQGAMPPPPQPPGWMQDPSDPMESPQAPRMTPIRLFSHGVCIESLVGNLGIGFGAIEADLNRAANTALSQFTDAGTFANIGAFLVPGDIEFKQNPAIEPGAFIRMPGMSAEDMKGILPIQMPQPSAALKEVFELMHSLGQTAIQAPEVLSGEPGKSGETFRGLSERVEQATKQLSVPTRKFGDFFQQILLNNAKINSVNLPDGEIASVIAQQITDPQDAQGPLMQAAQRGRELYAQSYQVEIRSDLRFTSTAQRIQEADQVVALAGPTGPLAGNLPLMRYALQKSFEARGRRDLIKFLGPELPPNMTPLGLPPPPPPMMGASGQGPPQLPGKPATGAAKPNGQTPNAPPHQPPQPGMPGIQ